MSARQLIVLAVAFVAAIGALLLIRGMNAPAAAPQAAAVIQGEQVLVVTRAVAQGVALSGGDLAWRAFPSESITSNFIAAKSQPEARNEFVGAVTRRAFVEGEPITVGSIVKPEDHGYMAAQLPIGYRAISIRVAPEEAAGGYIQPNDRVDVLLTTKIDGGQGPDRVSSAVVVQDVRVLALGEHAQPPEPSAEGPEKHSAETAILELTAEDARAVRAAASLGDLSLALRGVESEPAGLRPPSAQPRRAVLEPELSQVRLHAFGRVSNVGEAK